MAVNRIQNQFPQLSFDDYVDLRWKNRDKFSHYRQSEPWDPRQRQVLRWGGSSNRIFPKVGPFKENVKAPPTHRLLLRAKDNEKFEDLKDDDITGRPEREKNKIRAVQTVITDLKQGFGVSKLYKFNKTIGAGGCGFVALVDQFDLNNKYEGVLGMKVSTSSTYSVLHEGVITSIFNKAQHIIQTPQYNPDELITLPEKEAYLAALAAQTAGGARPRTPAELAIINKKPEPMDAMLMEYVPNGDLAQIIKKLNRLKDKSRTPDKVYIPNRVLWRFFLCMIRLCIGMAYPPNDRPDNQLKNYPIMETIPQDKLPRRIVHFDLDPKNIFVHIANKDDEEHRLNPVLKLADFGLTQEILPDQPDQYYEQLRNLGKTGFLAPEQFCARWDTFANNSDKIKTDFLAGNYGIHTNLWHVGLSMECLITGLWRRSPGLNQSISDVVFDGGEPSISQSFGSQLLLDSRYDVIDSDLRKLIAGCQAYFPVDRPTLAELEPYVLQAVQTRQYPGETDQEILDWFTKMLPPPPPPPPEPARRNITFDENYDDDDDDDDDDNNKPKPKPGAWRDSRVTPYGTPPQRGGGGGNRGGGGGGGGSGRGGGRGGRGGRGSRGGMDTRGSGSGGGTPIRNIRASPFQQSAVAQLISNGFVPVPVPGMEIPPASPTLPGGTPYAGRGGGPLAPPPPPPPPPPQGPRWP